MHSRGLEVCDYKQLQSAFESESFCAYYCVTCVTGEEWMDDSLLEQLFGCLAFTITSKLDYYFLWILALLAYPYCLATVLDPYR